MIAKQSSKIFVLMIKKNKRLTKEKEKDEKGKLLKQKKEEEIILNGQWLMIF